MFKLWKPITENSKYSRIIRSSWPALALLVLLVFRYPQLESLTQKNFALLKLMRLWDIQAKTYFDPPCIVQGDYKNLIYDLTLGGQTSTPSSNVQTHLGRYLWLEGECNQAITVWQNAGVEQNEAALFELFRIGRFGTLTLDQRHDLADYAYRRAIDLYQDQQNHHAYQWFVRAFDLMPERRNADMVVVLGDESSNDFNASKIWQRMIDGLPDTNEDYWWAVGRLAALEQAWGQAASAYARGAMISSDPNAFWIEAGRAWENVGNWKQALIAYQRANDALPEDPRAYWGLGNAYLGLQNYPDALHWFHRGIEKCQQCSIGYYYLGVTHFFAQNYDLAKLNLEKSLDLQPNHSASMYYLAKIENAEGQADLAERWMVRAIQNEQHVPAAWWLLLGDWRMAIGDCLGSSAAYTNALNAGTTVQVIQSKMNALEQVCNQ